MNSGEQKTVDAQEQALFDAYMQRTAPKAWKAEYDLAQDATAPASSALSPAATTRRGPHGATYGACRAT